MAVTDRTPNQRDIARAAGVSVSTVSRALSNSAGISGEMRRRIATLAAELGYAVGERVGPATEVALFVAMNVFPTTSSGFYQEIVDSIQEELDRRGVPMETVFVEGDRSGVDQVATHCEQRSGSGVMLIGIDDPEVLGVAAERAGAALLVNGVDPLMRLDGVTPSNRRGAVLATKHLIELGHRRIANVTWLGRPTLRDRLDGFKSALRDADLAFDPNLVIEIETLEPEAAYAAARSALASGGIDATAILCGNDLVAAGVIRALAEKGLRVPEDYSVVGFDDTRITARLKPSLTTVAVDQREIGRLSVARLLDRLRTPTLTPVDIHIGCRLVVRDSTAPLAPA